MSASVAETAPVEQFSALAGLAVRHGFVGRVAGLDVNTDRVEALARLDVCHREARRQSGVGDRLFVTAEQVHGDRVAVLARDGEVPRLPCSGADGIVTDRPDICLGIYVADCCAVYLVDPIRRVVGLVHSGRKGTELEIVAHAIQSMRDRFGTCSQHVIVQLSPCIRPPWYEVDFSTEIVAQCRAAGVIHVANEAACTAAHPDRYYSYRREKGQTGRMLAFLALH